MTAAESRVEPILSTRDIRKSYGGVHALKGVDFDIYPGEVHGLCGENGSGKSTLLKIISAQISPDSGEVLFAGSPAGFSGPVAALELGIATVTQERALVDTLTVGENVLLGHNKPRAPWGIDWRGVRRKAREVLECLGNPADVDTPVSELAPGQAQLVEIARAISRDIRVLILDEPTSSLSATEVEALVEAIRALRSQGVAIIFISHRLPEIYELCDRITILRDGRRVSSGPIAEYPPERIMSDMLGRELTAFSSPEQHVVSDSVLEVRGLSLERSFAEIDLALGRGEILGIAGLVGAGHTQLVETIFGLHPSYDGEIRLNGEPVRVQTPRAAMKHKIGFVPGDRKTQGLVLDMSVLENATMSRSAFTSTMMPPRSRTMADYVKRAVADFGIVTESTSTPVVRLSGGNQQKVLIAKWLGIQPEVLVLDEPTRGVDVGAKAEIYRILFEQRAAGLSIVVSSSEIPELLTLCDRIAVMHGGRLVAIMSRQQASEEAVLRHAMGFAHEGEI